MTIQEIDRHAGDYRQVVEALRDETIDLEAAAGLPTLNVDVEVLLGFGVARD
jgi:hypothetical protein